MSSLLEKLTIDEQIDVWSWCFGQRVDLGRLVTSPFRSDTTPGCNLKEYKGVVFFMDSKGTYGHGFTCLHAVAHFGSLYRYGKLDLGHAARFVEYHLFFNKRPILYTGGLLKGYKRSLSPGGSTIKILPKGGTESPGWAEKDIQYWGSRGIGSKQLEDTSRGGRVYSCSHYIINSSVFTAEGLCFAYTINGKIKVYNPNVPKERKWFSTVTQNDYWHTERGCQKLLIAKAQKDHLICENLFPGYDILSGMNERTLPENLPEILDRYKETIAVFDEDETGLRTLNQLKELAIRPFVVDVPGCKDIDDVVAQQKTLKFKEV